MSLSLRIILVISSLVTFWYIARKLRKAQMQVADSVFWIITAIAISILSFFPDIAFRLAALLGIESPVNFVFLSIIFILLMKTFLLSIKISQLEYKVKRLVEEMGVRNCKKEEK